MTAKTAGAERALAWPDDPETVTAEDVDFEALAHVLANTCRRGGCLRQYPLGGGACGDRVGGDRGARRARRRGPAAAGAARAHRGMRRPRGSGGACRTRSARRTAPGKLATGIETAVREAAGLDAVIEEEPAELLRFVTRMAAAAESRDLLDEPALGAGVAFPPLKRRIRSIPPDKAAAAWLARFRALAGTEAEAARGASPARTSRARRGCRASLT